MSEKLNGWPSPEDVHGAALKAANYPRLKEYYPTVSMLRESGWSDRKIAKFLKSQGMDVTFSQIYYLRTAICLPEDFKSFEEYQVWREFEAQRDAEFETQENGE